MAEVATNSALVLESWDEALEANLLAVLQSSALPLNEKEAVEACIADLKVVFCSEFSGPPPWKIAAFGSSVNGFGSKGCDIDIVAYQEIPSGGCNIDARIVLRKLEQSFKASSVFVVREAVLQARVRIPILKLRYGDRDVDLSVNNTGPLPNTRLLRAYAASDKRVAALGVAVKLWAKAAFLCGAPSGHLSPYALVMMVIYFLQIVVGLPCLQVRGDACFEDEDGAEAALSGGTIERSLAQLFGGFFAFYASGFRWGTEVVSVRLGSRRNKSDAEFSSLKKSRERRLHIEDPFDRGRNLSDVFWDGRERDLLCGLQATHAALSNGHTTDVLQDLFNGKTARATPNFRGGVRRGWSDTYWKNGSDSHRGPGHTLPRKRITSSPVSGRVLEWKGKFGWLRADEAIDHEKCQWHDGRVFLSTTDVLGGSVLRPQATVRFHLFSDDNGIGAEECLLVE